MAFQGDFLALVGITAVLSGMAPKPLEIAVTIVGELHPRFVIVNNRRQFWGGTDWTTDFRSALLYAHANLVQRDVEDLRQRLCR
jgi:hypothetical protein